MHINSKNTNENEAKMDQNAGSAKHTGGAQVAVNPLKTEDLTSEREMFLGRHLMRHRSIRFQIISPLKMQIICVDTTMGWFMSSTRGQPEEVMGTVQSGSAYTYLKGTGQINGEKISPFGIRWEVKIGNLDFTLHTKASLTQPISISTRAH